jgi:hypothetical protein
VLLPAPVEHQLLPSGESVCGDAREPADVASLERIHPCVVQAETELRFRPPYVLERALDCPEVFVAVPHDPKADALPRPRIAITNAHVTVRLGEERGEPHPLAFQGIERTADPPRFRSPHLVSPTST